MKPTPLILTENQIGGKNPAAEAYCVVCKHFKGLKMEDLAETVRRLPQHWRPLYTTFWLDGQVNNGGHHQFFWNSDGALNKETLEDLRLISAQPFILLFEEAIDEYERHDYDSDKLDSGNTWEAFTEAYKEKRMRILDEAFWSARKTIPMYLADFIRSHRGMFIDS